MSQLTELLTIYISLELYTFLQMVYWQKKIKKSQILVLWDNTAIYSKYNTVICSLE